MTVVTRILMALGLSPRGAKVVGVVVDAVEPLVEPVIGALLDPGAGDQGPPMPLTYKDVEWQQRQIRSASRPAEIILAEQRAARPMPPPRKR
jgi:hypothetical protein